MPFGLSNSSAIFMCLINNVLHKYLDKIMVVFVDPEKIREIEEWLVPKDVIDVRSFMGITGYYRRFIEGFSRIANPITSLQKKGRNSSGVKSVKIVLKS